MDVGARTGETSSDAGGRGGALSPGMFTFRGAGWRQMFFLKWIYIRALGLVRRPPDLAEWVNLERVKSLFD